MAPDPVSSMLGEKKNMLVIRGFPSVHYVQAPNPAVLQGSAVFCCFWAECLICPLDLYCLTVLFNSIPFLTFYLLVLQVTRRVMSKSPTLITALTISLFIFPLCIWQLDYLVNKGYICHVILAN